MHKWSFIQAIMDKLGGTWKPYVYATDVLTVTNGIDATKPFTVQLVDSKPFIWTEGLYQTDLAAVQAGADVLFGGLFVKFDELSGQGQGGKTWFPIESLFSRGGINGGARDLPFPMLFPGSGTISGEVQNKTASTMQFKLSFIGVKQY